VALASLASLAFQRAGGIADFDAKTAVLDEAKSWYEKLAAANPRNKEAFYSIGVIAWAKWYPRFAAARSNAGMRPEEPGPIRDAAVRRNLKSLYWAIIDGGIANLQKALDIDPRYDDAMAYLNLLFRERADLRDTGEAYRGDIDLADKWLQKAMETRRKESAPPSRIRIGAEVQQSKLIRKVDPVCPAESRRIQGAVRLAVIIGTDGKVINLQLMSGHPLLVPAAMEAVRQWVYAPTLLNGKPVEVVTEILVHFNLPQ